MNEPKIDLPKIYTWGRLTALNGEVINRKVKHGMCGTRIHRIWKGMRSRCLTPTDKSYPHYGGRGIRICERWTESFENFYNDMVDGYKEDLSLDRIDNNGDYELSNCRWADSFTQNNNSRKSLASKGYTPNRGKYQAQFIFYGEMFYGGLYNTEEEAHDLFLAYKKVKGSKKFLSLTKDEQIEFLRNKFKKDEDGDGRHKN